MDEELKPLSEPSLGQIQHVGRDDEFDVARIIDIVEPTGTTLFQADSLRIIAPDHTDFPVSGGKHLQIVDDAVSAVTENDEVQNVVLSDAVDPKALIRAEALGIAVSGALLREDPQTHWVNLNCHPRGPMTPYVPNGGLWRHNVVDVHGRDITGVMNWSKPPLAEGEFGLSLPPDTHDKQSVGDIEAHKKDPLQTELERVEKKTVMRESYPDDRTDTEKRAWRTDQTGTYSLGGRREYSPEEIEFLQRIFSSETFKKEATNIMKTPLFEDTSYKGVFREYADDAVLWQHGAYQLVTQRVPLVDKETGIHMVLKVRQNKPGSEEPHTVFENPQATLEAFAIGIGVSRLFTKHPELIGSIGDAYFDFNANWSMHNKLYMGQEESGLTPDEIKKKIQENTRAHLHIQLVKAGERWELPPQPGTFGDYEGYVADDPAVGQMKNVLNDPENGLTSWILENCR